MGFHRLGAISADPAATQYSNARRDVLTGRAIEAGHLRFKALVTPTNRLS
ncbi:MAG: hypothetical protein ACREPA_02490 [Candidatus Dormibacteraceae bacterium]